VNAEDQIAQFANGLPIETASEPQPTSPSGLRCRIVSHTIPPPAGVVADEGPFALPKCLTASRPRLAAATNREETGRFSRTTPSRSRCGRGTVRAPKFPDREPSQARSSHMSGDDW
jgi:hypothetical protein